VHGVVAMGVRVVDNPLGEMVRDWVSASRGTERNPKERPLPPRRLAMAASLLLTVTTTFALTDQGYPARITSSVRGPCTPLTRSSSMSAVAEGPETKVSGRPASMAGRSRGMASGSSPTTWEARTTHRK